MNCPDPAASLLLCLAVQGDSESTLASMEMSLNYTNQYNMLDTRLDEAADTYQLTVDNHVVCTVGGKLILCLPCKFFTVI